MGTHTALGELGQRQHCVFTPDQLAAIGISRSASRQRVGAGRLFRIHRAVYGMVPADRLTRDGRFMAAVLACGPEAALSHRSAAQLHELRFSERSGIEVTVPICVKRVLRGLQVHRSRTLRPEDMTILRGIPVTTVARTLLDLAEVVPTRGVERALDQAEMTGRLDLAAVTEQLSRNRGRHRAHVLAALLARDHHGDTITWSELEERFLALCRRAGLPDPEINALIVLPDGGAPIHGDFVWRAQRLIIETDGRASHRTARSFEDDRVRDQRATLAGWRVVRITWRQVVQERQRTVALVQGLLAAPA